MEEKLNQETLNEMFDSPDFLRMWKKCHTPFKKELKVGRNDICPYCNSGLKFKKCECYKKYGETTIY